MRVLENSRRFRIAALIGLPLLLSVGIPSLVLLDNRPTNQRAEAWVTAHANSLPKSLDEFAAYPTPYRRAIWSGLSESVKADLWRTQLDQLLNESSLTKEQRSAIIQMRSFLSPELYKSNAKQPAALQAMCRKDGQTAALLADYRAWLADLGSHARPKYTTSALAVTAYEGIRAKVNAVAHRPAPFEDCSCNSESMCSTCDWAWTLTCAYNEACHGTPQGCGCLWVNPCDGKCRSVLGGG